MPRRKRLIERAYREGERLGLAVWCADEAGPYQAIAHPGSSWQPTGEPARYPHEQVRGGTAKPLTLFHPATGQVRVKGVTRTPNAILHPWLEAELSAVVATLPQRGEVVESAANRAAWARWREGLSARFTLLDDLPPLRLLLIPDNLAGHKSATFVCGLMAHGIMPLYTPLGGSGLNMAESTRRILVSRALSGQHPESPAQIMAGLEAVGRGWYGPNPLRMGWQARGTAPASLGTTPSHGRFRGRYGSAAFVATGRVVLAMGKPNAPLGRWGSSYFPAKGFKI